VPVRVSERLNMETTLQGNCINCGTAWETVQQIRDLARELERLRVRLADRSRDHHDAGAMLDAVHADNPQWLKTHLGVYWEDCTDDDCKSDRQALSEGAP